MAVGCHLGFYRTANNAIPFADPETPSLEPNVKWIGCTVWKILAFILHCTVTLKLGFRVTQGHRRWHHSIEHIRIYLNIFYSSSIVTMPLSLTVSEIAAYWSKIATPLYLAPPLGVTPSHLRNDSWWRKTKMMDLSVRWKNLCDTFRFYRKFYCKFYCTCDQSISTASDWSQFS